MLFSLDALQTGAVLCDEYHECTGGNSTEVQRNSSSASEVQEIEMVQVLMSTLVFQIGFLNYFFCGCFFFFLQWFPKCIFVLYYFIFLSEVENRLWSSQVPTEHSERRQWDSPITPIGEMEGQKCVCVWGGLSVDLKGLMFCIQQSVHAIQLTDPYIPVVPDGTALKGVHANWLPVSESSETHG